MKIVGWSVVILLLALFALKTFFVGYYRIPQNGRSEEHTSELQSHA